MNSLHKKNIIYERIRQLILSDNGEPYSSPHCVINARSFLQCGLKSSYKSKINHGQVIAINYWVRIDPQEENIRSLLEVLREILPRIIVIEFLFYVVVSSFPPSPSRPHTTRKLAALSERILYSIGLCTVTIFFISQPIIFLQGGLVVLLVLDIFLLKNKR